MSLAVDVGSASIWAPPHQRGSACAFEIYVEARLNGDPTNEPFLDSLAFYEATQICEWLGAVDLFGLHYKVSLLGEPDLAAAAERGFQITRAGKAAIVAFVDNLFNKRSMPRKEGRGVDRLLGTLARNLRRRERNEDHLFLRQVIVECAAAHSVHHWKTKTALGIDVPEAKTLSICSASEIYGIHNRHLRQSLLALGAIGPETAKLHDSAVRFDRDTLDPVLKVLSTSMNQTQAATYLNIDHDLLGKLHDAGLIPALVARCSADSKPLKHFAKDELDRFAERMTKQARPLGEVASGLKYTPGKYAQISGAAMRVGRSPVSAYELVLSGEMTGIFLHPHHRQLNGVFLDVEELRSKVRLEVPEEYGIADCVKVMRASANTIRKLAELGHLPSRIGLNPVNMRPQFTVRCEDLHQFVDTFVSLTQLRGASHRHGNLIRDFLAADNIRPAFDRDAIEATYYRRSDVQKSALGRYFRAGMRSVPAHHRR